MDDLFKKTNNSTKVKFQACAGGKLCSTVRRWGVFAIGNGARSWENATRDDRITANGTTAIRIAGGNYELREAAASFRRTNFGLRWNFSSPRVCSSRSAIHR